MISFSVGTLVAQDAKQDGNESVSELLGQILQTANRVRSTPITEPGVPSGQGANGNWKISVTNLGGGAVVGTYELAPSYKFFVQGWICTEGKDKYTPFDATVLGVHETASVFYEANSSYFARDDADTILCLPVGMRMTTSFSPDPGGRGTLSRSEERVLKQMSNWLLFFAKSENDMARSADFLPFILNRYRMLLLDVNQENDPKELAAEISFFDQMFPFSVFDLNIPLSDEGRGQVREFFRIMLVFRNKLKALSPDVGHPIDRDTGLLKKFQ
jgi:hypothetical protein